MASGGDTSRLTDGLLARLAAVISIYKMKSIAESYLGIQNVAIENKAYDAGDAEDLNRKILHQWRNQYRGPDALKALADILYRAAEEHGYIDPDDVMTTLGISQEDITPVTSAPASSDEVTEDDITDIADIMRPFYKKKMKITKYPWQKSGGVHMDKLFVETTLEKHHQEAMGRKSKMLKNYKELFDPNMIGEGERILLKGEPGTGKTTLLKKITHDWVNGDFNNVSIVFFIFLKFVKRDETIENVILNQAPTLRGMKVKPNKVRRVLAKFGPRCLLVLDGLDEHALGQNNDVVRIIEESKYPYCKVIVTSRPHSTKKIEEHFDTIGRVEGFTKNEARKFVESIVDGEEKVAQILNFNPTSSWKDIFFRPPLYKVPILLSIMCYLVQTDEEVVRLLNKETRNRGWIYFRMVRCLFMAHIEKKESENSFDRDEFVKVVRSVGKLAWETLLSKDPQMVSKEEVIRIVGEDVFAWGLLIGDEDADRLTDETKHILVTFAHRSIQEFFGAFYFILRLSEGESIVSLLGGDCEKPIFLTNPLFFEFCLWLMNSTELTSFPWEVETVREPLATYIAGKIDEQHLDLDHKFYPFKMTDGSELMVLDLMKDVLSRCSKIECLYIDISLPVKELLSVVNPCLWDSQIHTLCLFKDFSVPSERPENPEGEFHIHLYRLRKPLEMLRVALKYCYRPKRRPCIRVDVVPDSSLELSELFQINDIRQLHVDCDEKGAPVSCDRDIPSCPSLKQLSVKNLSDSDDVLSALSKAIQRGHLSNLNYLDFCGCSFKKKGILHYLFWYRTPALKHLNLSHVRLNRSDLQFISELRTLRYLFLSAGPFLQTETVQYLFQNPNTNIWATLSVLGVSDVDSEFWEGFVRVVNDNKLTNLEKLFLSDNEAFTEKTDSDIADISLPKLQAEKLPSLKCLSLNYFIFSGEDVVHDLAQRLVKWDLEVLRITSVKGISGHLSVLFSHRLPSLTDLALWLCELNSDDMRCLTEAREQGKLPKLKYLNVSFNRMKDPEMWIENEAWKSVVIDHKYQEEVP